VLASQQTLKSSTGYLASSTTLQNNLLQQVVHKFELHECYALPQEDANLKPSCVEARPKFCVFMSVRHVLFMR